MVKIPDCILLILTYKGIHHLQYLLPTVSDVVSRSAAYHIQTWIVDNSADTETQVWVETHFPDFRYFASQENAYLFSLNRYVSDMASRFTLILNDDMRLHPEVLNQTIPLMEQDPSLFAVNCRIRDWDDEYDANNYRTLSLANGWASSAWGSDHDAHIRYTLYPGGGSALFRVSMFNELGGFNRRFYPAYAEDLDLGHRAWQQGYKTIYQPAAVIWHREGGTIHSQFKKNKLMQQIYTNRLQWMLMNIHLPNFLSGFLFRLPYRIIVWLLMDRNQIQSLFRVVAQWGPVMSQRHQNRSKRKIEDTDISRLLGTIYEKESKWPH